MQFPFPRLPWHGEYILDEHGNPVPEKNWLAWGAWMQKDPRRVVQSDRFIVGGNSIHVSTIFLGLDQAFFVTRALRKVDHEPVLWETMIFGGEHDRYCDRYTSLADALVGHAVALAIAKGDREQLEKLYELKDTRE